MRTFHWKIKPGMEVNSAPVIKEVKFGDGYSQRAQAALNADLKKYTVSLSVSVDAGMQLELFLAEHGGYKAFLWTPPFTRRVIKVVCKKWTSRIGAIRAEFSAEFEQVIA